MFYIIGPGALNSGAYTLKLFTVVTIKEVSHTSKFVTACHFHPSLMFSCKARVKQSRVSCCVLEYIRLGWK